MAGQPVELMPQACQLVIMRCEQGPASIRFMKMFQRRPGNGKPIIGCRTPADLKQNEK